MAGYGPAGASPLLLLLLFLIRLLTLCLPAGNGVGGYDGNYVLWMNGAIAHPAPARLALACSLACVLVSDFADRCTATSHVLLPSDCVWQTHATARFDSICKRNQLYHSYVRCSHVFGLGVGCLQVHCTPLTCSPAFGLGGGAATSGLNPVEFLPDDNNVTLVYLYVCAATD